MRRHFLCRVLVCSLTLTFLHGLHQPLRAKLITFDIGETLQLLGETWEVDNSDPNNCYADKSPFCKIQQAVDKVKQPDAAPIHTIKIAKGDYSENISLEGLANKTITFKGAGAEQTIINGNDNTVISVGEGVTVNISGLTLRNGGNGLYNAGKAVVRDAIISHNMHSGIGNQGGTLTLINSRVIINESTSNGAGIYNCLEGSVEIIKSTVSYNQMTSDIGGGGGIYNCYKNSNMSIIDSTVSNNTSYSTGGGISNGNLASLSVINSTISGNEAKKSGGGIVNYGTVQLRNVTISNNKANLANDPMYGGGGIWNDGNKMVSLDHTILVGNSDKGTQGPNDPECMGKLSSKGFNMLGVNSDSCTDLQNGFNNDRIGVNPLLRPLDNYGGPTQTHAFFKDSPVINAGAPTGCTDFNGNDLQFDQRGRKRSGVCDLGAVAWAPFFIGEPPIFFPGGGSQPEPPQDDEAPPGDGAVSPDAPSAEAKPADVADGTKVGAVDQIPFETGDDVGSPAAGEARESAGCSLIRRVK